MNSYHQLNNDYNDALLPGFRRLHESTAVLVDNIDEYYEGVLREMNAGRERPAGGRVKRSFWHLAQYGIAAAARELSHINTHVKIYVSIRKEVLQGIIGDTYFGQQLRSKSLIVSYTDSDLLEIVREHRPLLMPRPIRAPTTRYRRSSAATRVTHPTTGDEEEEVLRFWLRRILGRCRQRGLDRKGHRQHPPANRSERKIRGGMRIGSQDHCHGLFCGDGASPRRVDFDMLLRLIDKNVLSPEDLKRISKSYADTWLEAFSEVRCTPSILSVPCCKLGLLGYVVAMPRRARTSRSSACPANIRSMSVYRRRLSSIRRWMTWSPNAIRSISRT